METSHQELLLFKLILRRYLLHLFSSPLHISLNGVHSYLCLSEVGGQSDSWH